MIYLDLGFCFFLIRIPAFSEKCDIEPSSRLNDFLQRTKRALHIFPFLLNLSLKPLYSRRGGSTTRAEPFTNNPIPEERRQKPL